MPTSFPNRRAASLCGVVTMAMLGALGAACSESLSLGGSKTPVDIADQRPVTIEHEACDIQANGAQKVDSNGDGKVDIISVQSGGKEVCRALDLNMDGRIDRYVYFDDGANVRRVESDYDRDGRIDEVSVYKAGALVRKDREMNLDGKVDTWDVYQDGKLVRRERDTDGDGKVDQWWTFPDPNNLGCPVVAVDKDGSGHPTPGTEIDMCKPQGDEPANILATSTASPFGSASAGATPGATPPPPPPSSSGTAPPATSGSASPASSGGK